MPWTVHAGVSLTAPNAKELDWHNGWCTLDVFDDAFVDAMKMFARRKECNGITISMTHKNIWFKRIPDGSDPVQDAEDQSWRFDGETWSHFADMDFPSNDDHWIVWGTQDRDKLSFNHWDSDFIEAMQVFADRKEYRGIEISDKAVIFKSIVSLADSNPEMCYCKWTTKAWIKREACQGSHRLFLPVERCIEQVREDLVKETNKDPLPQFTCQQIADTTGFLSAAIAAMQTFVNSFSEGNLEELTDEQLQTRQLKSREASRRLGLLFGDTRHDFTGMSSTSTFAITHSQQANETREHLTKLRSFFQAFGQEQWLGTLLATEEFAVKLAMAIEMLGSLLEPSKVSLTSMPPAEELLQSVLSVLAQNINAQQAGSIQHMNALVQVTQELSVSLQAMREQMHSKQHELNVKMDKLQCFAEQLTMIPGVLNKYLLIRLGEIDDSQDLSILKKCISKEEATEAHQFLEAFRDSATEERAVRRIRAGASGRVSSVASVASSSEFHFVSQ